VIERDALLKGTAVTIVVCLPLALLSQAVADGDGEAGSLGVLLFLAVLAGFVLGGAVAARSAPEAPITNGAVAALAGYAVIQGVALLVRLAGGEDVNLVAIVFNGIAAYGCGLVGALIAGRSASR
jgi:hypothetical protein